MDNDGYVDKMPYPAWLCSWVDHRRKRGSAFYSVGGLYIGFSIESENEQCANFFRNDSILNKHSTILLIADWRQKILRGEEDIVQDATLYIKFTRSLTECPILCCVYVAHVTALGHLAGRTFQNSSNRILPIFLPMYLILEEEHTFTESCSCDHSEGSMAEGWWWFSTCLCVLGGPI